jgi:hypothetical protein
LTVDVKNVTYNHNTNISTSGGGAQNMADQKTTSLNLREFPKELHRQAKAKAALMGISLKEVFIRAVTEYLKKQK